MKMFIRKDDKAVSPVIAVILMVAITVVLAGVLWAMLSQMTTSGGEEAPKITMKEPDEYSYGWSIEVTKVSGGSLRLEDTKFQIFDAGNVRRYELFTTDADPSSLTLGVSKVFAVPSGSNAVSDSSTGATITATSAFANYQNCTLAYLDADDDGKVSSSDTIYMFKDVNSDGTDDLSAGYIVKIYKGGDFAGEKEL